MSSPLSFLIEHEDTILTAYGENNAKPKKAWGRLEKELPELSQSMTFNTFKQYVSVFAALKAELDKVRQSEVQGQTSVLQEEKKQLEEKVQRMVLKLDRVTQNRDEMQLKLDAAMKELDKVRQARKSEPRVRQKLYKNPRRISGWSVQHSKDGYYRCYRKIGKRVHSVYLGKRIDVKEAEKRIRAKEKSLGLI